jgi:hypothetical protein
MKYMCFFSMVLSVHVAFGMNSSFQNLDLAPQPWSLAQVDEELRFLAENKQIDTGLKLLRQGIRNALEISVLSDNQENNEYQEQMIAAAYDLRKAMADVRRIIHQKDLLTDSQQQASVLINQIWNDLISAPSLDYGHVSNRLGLCVFYWLGKSYKCSQRKKYVKSPHVTLLEKQIDRCVSQKFDIKRFVSTKHDCLNGYVYLQKKYASAISSVNNVLYVHKAYMQARQLMAMRATLSEAKYRAQLELFSVTNHQNP